MKAGTRLAALEMIRSGTTTFVDMYYFEDQVAEAAKEAGMRGVPGETLIEFPAPDNKTIAGRARLRRALPEALGRRPAGRAPRWRRTPRTWRAPETLKAGARARRPLRRAHPHPPLRDRGRADDRSRSATARRPPSTCATSASCARACSARTASG